MHHVLLHSLPLFSLLLGLMTLCGVAFGQGAISIHSGLIQFTEGSAFLNDQPFKKSKTGMQEIGKGGEFRTGPSAHAEVLLTPGVFLRLAKDSAIRMDSVDLNDTRVSVLKGSVMIECNELLKDNSIALSVGDQTMQIRKTGLFQIDADPPKVKVHKGQIFLADQPKLKVKKGKELALNVPEAKVTKFKTDKNDSLYQFSSFRSGDNAYATAVAAYNRSAFSGGSCGASSWSMMPQFGRYAYLPCSGMGMNPFGYYFFSPSTVYMYGGPLDYYPSPYAFGQAPVGVRTTQPGAGAPSQAGQGGAAATTRPTSPSPGIGAVSRPGMGAGGGGGGRPMGGPSMGPARSAPSMSAPRSSGPAPRTGGGRMQGK